MFSQRNRLTGPRSHCLHKTEMNYTSEVMNTIMVATDCSFHTSRAPRWCMRATDTPESLYMNVGSVHWLSLELSPSLTCTVESLLKDSPNWGHNTKTSQVLQSQWYYANTFLPLKEENLYITAKMTQKWLAPMCPLKRFHCKRNKPVRVPMTI